MGKLIKGDFSKKEDSYFVESADEIYGRMLTCECGSNRFHIIRECVLCADCELIGYTWKNVDTILTMEESEE